MKPPCHMPTCVRTSAFRTTINIFILIDGYVRIHNFLLELNSAPHTDMYPTKEEFTKILSTRTLDWIIDNYLFSGLPFYSSHQPLLHPEMIRTLSKGLDVPEGDICVVGSARIGFSLSPLKFGEPFSAYSDIDIVVISRTLFDPSWLDIVGRRRLNSSTLHPRTSQRLREHREHHYIYNGWIYPESIVEALEIGERWLRTFNGLSQIPELASRTVGGRLYRTWEHARLYHEWSLSKVKQAAFSS